MENGQTEHDSALDASVDRISALMGEPGETPAEPTQEAAPVVETTTPTPAELAALEVPKSWPKEMHEHWGTTPRQVQEYWGTREKQMLDGLEQYKTDAQYAKALREIFTPYQQTFKHLKVDEATAIRQLLQADHVLRYATKEQKAEYLKQIAKSYGIDDGAPATPVDPTVQALQQRVEGFEQAMRQQQEAVYREALNKSTQEVEAFKADEKAHPYYAEVEGDIAKLLQTGMAATLQEAYDLAVRLNPVTFEKEKARIQTEYAAQLKENARLDSLPKKRAAGVNVKASDSDRTPAEPIGSLEETIRQEHKRIREARVH